jgi:hypothetical protein
MNPKALSPYRVHQTRAMSSTIFYLFMRHPCTIDCGVVVLPLNVARKLAHCSPCCLIVLEVGNNEMKYNIHRKMKTYEFVDKKYISKPALNLWIVMLKAVILSSNMWFRGVGS